MAAVLPFELLIKILDVHKDDPDTLYTCILIDRSWCNVGIQYLWANPFQLFYSRERSRVENLLVTFIECFTDIENVTGESDNLAKKYSKNYPFDYSSYLKSIDSKHVSSHVAVWINSA